MPNSILDSIRHPCLLTPAQKTDAISSKSLPRAPFVRTNTGLARAIHAVDGEYVLGKIDPDSDNSQWTSPFEQS
jgi:hypothetical protein